LRQIALIFTSRGVIEPMTRFKGIETF